MRARSLFAYSSLRFVPLVISTVGTFLLALSLGIAQFGIYSAAIATTQIIAGIGLLGQEQLIMQGKLRLRTAVLRCAVIVGGSAAVAIVVGLFILPPSSYPILITVIASAAVIQAFSVLFSFMLLWGHTSARAADELWLRASYQVGLNASAIPTGSALLAALGGFASAIVGSVIVVRQFLKSRTAPHVHNFGGTNETWFRGTLFGLDGVLYSLGLTVPVLVIAATQSPEVNAQARIVILCYTGIVSVSRAFNGEMFRSHLYRANSPEERMGIWRSMRKTLAVYGIAVSIGTVCVAIVLPLILGSSYRGASLALLWLAGGTLLQFFGYGMSTLAVTNGFIRASILRHSLTLAVSVALSFVLSLGPVQLAWILIANDLLSVLFFLVGRRTWGVTPASTPVAA